MGITFRPCDSGWNQLLQRFSGHTIFHTEEWLGIISRVFKAELRKFLVYDGQGGEPSGMFPLFSIRRGPLRIFASPLSGWATPRLGPLLEGIDPGGFMEGLNDMLSGERAHYVEVSFVSDVSSELPESFGYNLETRYTYILRLEPDEGVMWGKITSKCRNMVRKALKNGVSIYEPDSDGWIGLYHDMALDVYSRSGRLPPIGERYLREIWETLRPRNAARVLMAEYEGVTIAGAIFLIYGDWAYYWDGVSYRAYNRVAPNNLIQWEFIKWASGNGVRMYDMIGANNPGIAKFKASFGPELFGYTYAYRNLSPISSMARTFYRKFAPVTRKLRRWMFELRRTV